MAHLIGGRVLLAYQVSGTIPPERQWRTGLVEKEPARQLSTIHAHSHFRYCSFALTYPTRSYSLRSEPIIQCHHPLAHFQRPSLSPIAHLRLASLSSVALFTYLTSLYVYVLSLPCTNSPPVLHRHYRQPFSRFNLPYTFPLSN